MPHVSGAAVATLIGIVSGIITILVALAPWLRRLFRIEPVYAACIAELSQVAPGLLIETPLDKLMPIRRFPGFSDWSIQAPNIPPRAKADSQTLFETIDTQLSGQTLLEANQWERTCPPELKLFGQSSSREFKLYQTYLRLRWLLLKDGAPDYGRVVREAGQRCADALRGIEAAVREQLQHLPTRVLIVRVRNRGARKAKNLHIEATSGGEIYDVVIDNCPNAEIVTTSVRLSLTCKVIQPGQTVELKLWYRWLAVAFGSRMGSQAESFPGREGMLITHLGISNGRVSHSPRLLADLEAWRSLETKVGPEPGFGRF
ncbi:MAG TPA: hypothetical protein VIY53_12670 [Acidobacteriaceae bacterium]